MEHAQPNKVSSKGHTTRLTKVAFLAVFLVAVVGFVKVWTERQGTLQQQEEKIAVQDGSKIALDSKTKDVFSPVSHRLYRDAFFGVSELDDGYSVLVAGYVRGEVTTEDGTFVEIQPFIVDESLPLSILISQEDQTVVVWKNGESSAQNFSKVRGSLKKGTPIAFTVFFTSETQYMLAVRGLEDFNDYLTLEHVTKPKYTIIFPSASISQIEILR